MRLLPVLLSSALFLASAASAADVPAHARKAADHAVKHYDDAQVKLLAELVSFPTVHKEGTVNAEQTAFRAFAAHLKQKAEAFGFDFTDHGALLVIGLGDGEERLGIVTHGDVQPADATKWQRSPFELDTTSEPGRLIARGTEDDKAPIATALYAMKTLKDLGLPLKRRVELIVVLTEESDWAPLLKILETWTPPQLNVAIDSNYPVVVAEKGWGGVQLTFAAGESPSDALPRVEDFHGGAFMSQVPEDASLRLTNTNDRLIATLRERIAAAKDSVVYTLTQDGDGWRLQAKGKAAHSSTPENGINALTHLAALLNGIELADTASARAIAFVNDLLGTGLYGERFGDIAWSHPFMGPLTVNLSLVQATDAGVELGINTRAPAGKSPAQLEREMRAAVSGWASSREWPTPAIEASLGEAYMPERPAQVEPLLEVFRHYTGTEDAQPISIGGGTNARLMPNAVNFGPSMPGVPYSGHSEHEFITREQMTLNLKMYTAMMTWLAAR